MQSFKSIREAKSLRSEILNRGEKKVVHPVAEDVVSNSVGSIIEMLQSLTEEKAGRIVIIEEGASVQEVFIDYETSQYLLAVYENLDEENQKKFEQTLTENVDSLDEIALYCECVIGAHDEDA